MVGIALGGPPKELRATGDNVGPKPSRQSVETSCHDRGMRGKHFPVKGKVEIFPQEGGWVFVRVPDQYTEMTRGHADRGLVAITAKSGTTTWNTSLMPMGDGTHFIALSAKVRRAENIRVGDTISLSFRLRAR
jgi:predicted pyridoxine 5'-phosphate oxidase superfamily flavin-nucleotide-binding protein